MSFSVSKPWFKSILCCTATARALLGSLLHQRWAGLRWVRSHFFVGRFARAALILILMIAVLLEPALAAEKKSRPSDKSKKEAPAFPSKQDLLAIEESILLLTNNERNTRGLPVFHSSSALAYLSKRQSENMCAARSLEHESDVFPNGWKKFTQRLKIAGLTSGAENIAYRTLREKPEKWAKEVVNGWMKSPQHRKNILDPRWRYLGVGVRMCSNRIAYAAQVFSSDPGRVQRYSER
jgi:uncharacterized protein YkwD